MKKQAQFFSFCLVLLFSVLFFQVTTGCGKQNFFPGRPSAFLLGREAYYSGDYNTALTYFDQVTGDATATDGEKKDARIFSTRLRLARTGNDLISQLGKVAGGVSFSGKSSIEVGSLVQNFIPTTEAAKADIRAAANTLNQLVRDGSVSTRDAAAAEVAIVSAQAATVAFTDAFDTSGDGKLAAADVQNLTTAEVTALYLAANGSSETFGTQGGISSYLNNAVTFGGSTVGSQLNIDATQIGTTDATAQDIHNQFLQGNITGAQLADLIGRSGQ